MFSCRFEDAVTENAVLPHDRLQVVAEPPSLEAMCAGNSARLEGLEARAAVGALHSGQFRGRLV